MTTNAMTVRDGAKALVESIADDVQMALPANITLDRFKATFITAVNNNPEILDCDPTSIKTSLMKCATDNLVPDNREAALVPFNTRIKGPDGKDIWVKLCQYMPMVQGVRKRALELGGARISAEVVYKNDHFDAVLGDDPHIEHRAPALGTPRGEILGAYAIFKDDKGNIIHREIMDKTEIEASRSVSRAKDGPGWTKFYGEFARKTVVRRGSKSVPNIPDALRTIIERDDDYVDFDQQAALPRTRAQGRLDHNPMVPARQETMDPDTGEFTPSGSDDRQPPAASTASRSSGSKESGGADRSSANGDRPTSSAAEPSTGTDTGGEEVPYRLSAEEFATYHGSLARMTSSESVTKADAQHWKGTRSPKSKADRQLCTDILSGHQERVANKLAADDLNNSVDGWISALQAETK